MSVLIKGMEMPTTCRDCRLSTFTDFDSMPFCNITMDDICLNDWETKRCDNCPLVPVPKHGRLGDLDALAQQIEHERFHHPHTDGLAARHHVAEYGHFLKVISDAPTIIPAEEGEG